MHDVAAPVPSEVGDGWELVHETGRGDHSPGRQSVAGRELGHEAVAVAGDVDDLAVEHLDAVAAHLLASPCRQLGRRHALVTEVAVHVGGWCVAGLPGVDDDHRSSLTAELERGTEAGGGSADNHDVAVAGGAGVVLLIRGHARQATDRPVGCNTYCYIRITVLRRTWMTESTIEEVVRSRLRSLRTTAGLSLSDLAARTNLSPSTISRIETGKRAISLDVLVPLASALHIAVEALLASNRDEDVVIRPSPTGWGSGTAWMLSRAHGHTIAAKVRLEPLHATPDQQVHPGHDWFYVLEGRVRLQLGERDIVVEAGQAAEFSTMTPHACTALDGPAEIIMIFDRDGQRAHVHHDDVV